MATLFGTGVGVCHALKIFAAKEFVGLDKTPGAMSWFNTAFAIGSSVNIFFGGKDLETG